MSKFFVDKKYVGESEILIKNLTDINHISKVLRLGIGDMLIISDSSDFDYQVEIIKIMSTEITCKILDKQKFAKEPSTKITLLVSGRAPGLCPGLCQLCRAALRS